MKALIELLDCLHIPFIIIGLYYVVIAAVLAGGLLYLYLCFQLLEFLSHEMGLDNSLSLWFTIYGPPIFLGFMGIFWLLLRSLFITDSLVNYLDKADDPAKACREVKSKVVKGALTAQAEAAPSMIINKIRDKV